MTLSRRRLAVTTAVTAVLGLVLAGVILTAWERDSPGAVRDEKAGSPAAAEVRTILEKGPPRPGDTQFRIVSFNILGGSHTRGSGAKARFAPGPERAREVVRILRNQRVSVAGLQEAEPKQLRVLLSQMPHMRAWPATRYNFVATTNSIVWDRRTWELVSARTIKIPYFHGYLQRMPYVLLENRSTGRRVWFANFHNPADAQGEAGKWRREATVIEARLVNRLSQAGDPVILTGDFNARTGFFCTITRLVPDLRSANGGSNRGECRPPADMEIDWILGTKPARFAEYRVVRSEAVQENSDHPVVFARVRVSGSAG